MNLSWSKEQLEYQKKVIDFAKEGLNSNVVQRDALIEFSRNDWRKCSEFGILGLASPKAYGGFNESIDLMTAILAMEGLGYGCTDNGLPFGLNAQMWTVQLPIVEFGTKMQKELFLRNLVSGAWIGCHALSEDTAGSDVFSMKTTAEKVEGGYLLNGSKRLITLGPVADVALVFCYTNTNLGKWGISGFLVQKGTKGFHQGGNKAKMGLRTVPIGDLSFENCFVADENRLGAEGAGWSIITSSLEYDRSGILASQLGAMDRQLENTIAFIKQRKQYGKSIGEFQSVTNRIADMKLRLETSRLLLYKVAWLKSTGASAILESALLKLHLSESFVASSLDAIRSHGGQGYLAENEIERDLRDAIGGIIYAGTSDIQRNIISNLLIH